MATKDQLRRNLIRFSEAIDRQPEPSSHKNLNDEINASDRMRMDFWTNPRAGTNWQKHRTIAYLCAYVETFGARFSADSTATDDAGSFVPDVSVMKSLLEGGCVRLSEDRSSFQLSPKGQALILPFVYLSDELSN
jgi:hypothetical protein